MANENKNENKDFTNSQADKDSSSKKSGGSRRGRRRPKEDREEGKKSSEVGSTASFATDPLVLDSANILFNTPVGTMTDLISGYQLNTGETIGSGVYTQSFSSTGFCTIEFIPTFGVASSAASPANVAARRLFQLMCASNSRTPSYGAPDPMMVLTALNSMFMLHYMAIRGYAALNCFSQQNRYYPRVLFQALGLDYDSWSKNMANLRLLINQNARKLKSFYLPKNFAFIADTLYYTSNIFLESNNIKSQAYVFRPAGWYQYSDTAGECVFSSFDSEYGYGHLLTWDEYQTLFEVCYTALADSEPVGIIDADILHTFGEDAMFQAPSIPDGDIVLVPTYNEAVLDAISNMMTLAWDSVGAEFATSMRIAQDVAKNNLVFQPDIPIHSQTIHDEGQANTAYAIDITITSDPIFNARDDALLTPASIAAKANFRPVYGYPQCDAKMGKASVRLMSCGSMIFGSPILYTYQVQDNVRTVVKNRVNCNQLVDTSASGLSSLNTLWLTRFSQFDWRPMVWR